MLSLLMLSKTKIKSHNTNVFKLMEGFFLAAVVVFVHVISLLTIIFLY